MQRGLPVAALSLLVLLAGFAVAPPRALALEIWSGRTFLFTKANSANPTLAPNQDAITPGVKLTRGNTQGLYNIAQEANYGGTLSASPLGTEWATGDAVNHASLTFATWTSWANNNPPGTVGVNAVVHLIAEDIYIDIRFESWSQGGLGGGGFSYRRAVQPPPVPTNGVTWGAIKALYR